MRKLLASLGGIFFLLILVGAGCTPATTPTAEEEANEMEDLTASVTIEGTEEVVE